MKNQIKLRVQRVLVIIPFINISIIAIWLYNYSTIPRDSRLFLRSFGVMFGYMFIIGIPQMILSLLFKDMWFIDIISKVCIYLIPFFMGYGLIRFQSKNGIGVD